jgi:hypothetical protein
MPYASSKKTTVHLKHLFNHCLRLSHFPKPWKEAKFITLPKPYKDLKFPQNLSSISLLSTTGKLFKKIILKILKSHIVDGGLPNASQFGFLAHQSMTSQCIRLTGHVTLNFNSNISTTVFLNIETAFNTT